MRIDIGFGPRTVNGTDIARSFGIESAGVPRVGEWVEVESTEGDDDGRIYRGRVSAVEWYTDASGTLGPVVIIERASRDD